MAGHWEESCPGNDISCCHYWFVGQMGGIYSFFLYYLSFFFRKFFAVFEILGHYRAKKAGLPPSWSAAFLLVYLFQVYRMLIHVAVYLANKKWLSEAKISARTPAWLQHSGFSEHWASLVTAVISQLRWQDMHFCICLDVCHFALGGESQDCDKESNWGATFSEAVNPMRRLLFSASLF